MVDFTIPSYIFQLLNICDDETVEDQCEVLENIFENKYSECIEIYWLIKKYAENISDLSYSHKQNKKLKSLTVTMKLKGVRTKKVIEELNETSPKGYAVKITSDKAGIHINIRKKKK